MSAAPYPVRCIYQRDRARKHLLRHGGQAARAGQPKAPWIDLLTEHPSCPACDGKGHYPGAPDDQCALCVGSGVVSERLALRFFAPPLSEEPS